MTTNPQAAVQERPLPCPFCGEKENVHVAEMGQIAPGWLTVQCRNCEGNGPWKQREDWAIEFWNRRAALSSASADRAMVQVPRDAYLWLMGAGADSFTPDREGAFWWRGAFNERAGLDYVAIWKQALKERNMDRG